MTSTTQERSTEERLEEIELLIKPLKWNDLSELPQLADDSSKAHIAWLVSEVRSLLGALRGDDLRLLPIPPGDPDPGIVEAAGGDPEYRAELEREAYYLRPDVQLNLEIERHAKTRRNLSRANRWIAHLERELHKRGGPAPRIAPLLEAQDHEQARPPTVPPTSTMAAEAFARGFARASEASIMASVANVSTLAHGAEPLAGPGRQVPSLTEEEKAALSRSHESMARAADAERFVDDEIARLRARGCTDITSRKSGDFVELRWTEPSTRDAV